MQLTLSTSVFLLLSAAYAFPSDLQKRADPPNDPVDLVDIPDLTKKFTCGQSTYTGDDIYKAAQYGVNLSNDKQTRGRNKYPHSFPNDDSKGNKLNFPKTCPADNNRYEYPLKTGGVYNGGNNNVNQGDERVVYYYEDGEVGNDGHPQAYYCGIMTHVGAPSGGFVLC